MHTLQIHRLFLRWALLLALALAFAQIAAWPQPAQAQSKRVALVIGNAAYAEGALRNPVNDARLMESSLKQLGFAVERVDNANFQRMQRAVR